MSRILGAIHWASFPNQKQAAVWASIGAPSATSLAELVSLQKRLQATLHSELELQVRVRDDRVGFGLTIRVWVQLEDELWPSTGAAFEFTDGERR